MPRGGRRPGAGAPKGNLNALRNGLRSKQLRLLIIALMAFPQTRDVLLHFSRLEQRRRDPLQKAVNAYARLLYLPSRERSIKTIQTKQTRTGGPVSKTIKPSAQARASSGQPPLRQ